MIDFRIATSDGEVIEAKFVINAAGLYADKIHNLICKESFKITPRSGEYFVMDKSQGKVVSHTIFQCPSKAWKRSFSYSNCSWKFTCWT